MQQICIQFPCIAINKNVVCDSCYLAKQCKLPFSTSNTKFFKPFDLIHMDIWGPLSICSIQSHHSFLTIVDDYSRYTWLHLMKSKADTRTCISTFLALVSTQFNAKVKIIRTDNGNEFNMSHYYSSLGIIHQTSYVETPQQNSTIERKYRHLLNVTRALLFHSHLPKCFWSYAVCHSVFLINRLPTPVLNHQTPYAMLHGDSPTFLDLKVFSCLSYATTLTQNQKQLDPRSRKCLFLGYKPATEGYILLDLHTRHICVQKCYFL